MQLSMHFSMACVQAWCCIVFPILRDVGSSRCHYIGCSSCFLFAPHWFAMSAVHFLNELHVVQNRHTERCSSPPGHMRIQAHQEIEAIKFPALCTSAVLFRSATGLVLSFSVRDCDDSSHMFDAFWRRFSTWLIAVSRLSMRVSAANVCCGKETTNDDADNTKLNSTDKSLMTTSRIFFSRLIWSFLLWSVLCRVRCEKF